MSYYNIEIRHEFMLQNPGLFKGFSGPKLLYRKMTVFRYCMYVPIRTHTERLTFVILSVNMRFARQNDGVIRFPRQYRGFLSQPIIYGVLCRSSNT
jgi:hypothetical protein